MEINRKHNCMKFNNFNPVSHIKKKSDVQFSTRIGCCVIIPQNRVVSDEL